MTGHADPAVGGAPPRRRGLRRRLTDNVTALLVIGGLKLVLHLPERPIWALADLGGDISYRFSTARRDRARRNLLRVLEWMAANGQGAESYRTAAADPKALETLVRSAFRNHARYNVELARAPRFTAAWVNERLEVENPAEVDAWLTPGRALILIGLHFGAIEVPGIFAIHRMHRIVSPMETIANARVQRYIFSTRDTIGIRIVTLEAAGVELLAALRRNEAVGLVADRDLTGGGIEVEMFGAMTKIPAGPVLLAAETGAPTYMSAVRRVGPGRYRGRVRQLPPPAGANRRERSRAMAREEARLFEQFIIDAPEQWLALFHPIWPDLELRDAKLAQPEVPDDGENA
jgi:phosphatidylinositol dimannoside acyltransferase